MVRRTITLSSELEQRLEREARLRGISVSEVVREAIEARFVRLDEAEHDLPFIGIGDSGRDWDASRFDEELEKSWPAALRADAT